MRTPHTVYVQTLYRIGGQDYCRHHIIRAAVAAGVIAEVKPGAGPVAAVPWGAHSTGLYSSWTAKARCCSGWGGQKLRNGHLRLVDAHLRLSGREGRRGILLGQQAAGDGR